MDGMVGGYQEQLCPGGGQGGKTPEDPCFLCRSSVSPTGLGGSDSGRLGKVRALGAPGLAPVVERPTPDLLT